AVRGNPRPFDRADFAHDRSGTAGPGTIVSATSVRARWAAGAECADPVAVRADQPAIQPWRLRAARGHRQLHHGLRAPLRRLLLPDQLSRVAWAPPPRCRAVSVALQRHRG